MESFLIVGLGNIGDEYHGTRHNIGFDIVDIYAEKNNLIFTENKLAFKTETNFKGRKIILIKPTTYMNLSGKAVLYWMTKEKINLKNILILVDDLDLTINKIKLKNTGSGTKGHNGLIDIEAQLNTTNYARLKFGIGHNFTKGKQVEFVLGKWNNTELPIIEKKLLYAADVINKFIYTPISYLMTEINAQQFV